ncbi:type II toxin-antitoxin system RelE/ParE family toxin [Candidatus Saccharibacteria bacterium]|nr:type II toxin-antitoxin system RelE/ParE family toxin [Candidatus Saccharibacteria bacterium]
MAFEVIFADGGRSTYDHIVNYFLNELENPRVAMKWMGEVREAQKRLEYSADSYPICEEDFLEKRSLRKIRLRHYNYKVFYKIKGNKVYIEAILHDKQSPGKWLG